MTSLLPSCLIRLDLLELQPTAYYMGIQRHLCLYGLCQLVCLFTIHTILHIYITTIQLKNTLNKSVDFTKLKRKVKFNAREDNTDVDVDKDNENTQDNKKDNTVPRLILVCTDIQRGEPVIFDSNQMAITLEH
jgi:hypothetical protein